MSTAIPEKIGRYQILERVGKGGMGVLFRGVDSVLDREVAIKLMLVDFSSEADEMRPRFYREARAAAKLQHPNIVTVFEFAEEGGTPYIVMEFLRGESLAQRMTSPVPLTLDDKLGIVAQLSTALSYAHEQGVVHRDVKPPNVFILPDGTVKLLDFGVAKLTSSTLTRQGDVLGSASYMSPEQVAGSESVDGRSDIFAVGVVLYELLAGRKPFHADAPTAIVVKILYEDPPPLDTLVSGLPPQLVAAVNKALAKDPANRYTTAAEFARELQLIRRNLQPSSIETPAFDETRIATPAEIQALKTHAAAARPAAPVATPADAGSTGAVQARQGWMVPVALGALVVAGAVAAFMLRGGSPAAATAASAPSPDTAAPVAAATAPASGAVARIQVASEPVGATIRVDGRPTNQTTPATVELAGEGPHRLRLSRAGFADQDATITPADLKRGTVSFTLRASEAPKVTVSIVSAYPVEVMDGTRTISNEGESHSLTVAPGTVLRVVATKYGLDTTVKAEGPSTSYQVPGLGFLTARARGETCSVMLGTHSLGNPPLTRVPVAAGDLRVDLACPDGRNPPGQFIKVTPGGEARVTFN